ncbi:transient receptor potential channel pyrexia isoform X1 [Spodoptera frugiperda]|uniref:Transient receptor potential channel pyrexia isoform X1 n=1 Tax=Spodoptera frugiperda TaxID=7108 RepID=A0A9R0DGQ1_SPOFR|nr:transient receptor potential channel pyrexia isoform X1 [Spodoptera frugiperda]
MPDVMDWKIDCKSCKRIASLFSEDIERGPDQDEAAHPLLNPAESGDLRIRMARPRHLGLEGRPPLPKLIMPDLTPSSVGSTVNSTPMMESGAIGPKPWRRGDRRLQRLNTELLEAIESHDLEEVERLLNVGASPNATCRLGFVSACHTAALIGGDALSLLIKFGAEKLRIDKLGRTPLHLAAWAGNARQVAILLDFPEDIQERVGTDSMSSETEEDVRKLCPLIKEMTNVRCDLGEVDVTLPKPWKDNIDHNCRDIKGSMPLFQPGWTPLHVASSCARKHCTRLLLAAGADPNITDVEGRTPLDVAGYAYYYEQDVNEKHFVEVITMLLKAGGTFNTMKNRSLDNLDTPLHTAVEIESLDGIQELLDAGAVVTCLNRAGQTPLHVCVKKNLEEHLQLLANYDYMNANPLLAIVDVKDKEGHSVLQAAVEAAWVPGVCIALEAGADVTSKANDGETPIHSAAALGNLDVLNEILSIAKQRDAIDYQNEEGETALYKAIINGHVNCVKQILNEGANLKITLPGDVNILHVAADYGHLEVLRVLLEFNETVTDALINTLTAGDRRGFGPIHFAVFNNHVECVELLLSKGADIRLRTTSNPYKSSTPLHLAAIKNHLDIAKILLKFDKTTVHEVNSMGWFPLHAASHHGSRDVITILLREGADLSGYTDGPKKYRRTAIDMIINNLSKPTEFMEDVFDSYISSNGTDLQDHNCEVTVDYGILMPTVCEMEQMKVIEALLKTGNRYGQRRLLVHPLVESFLFLKWKALLPFFYTIIGLYAIFLLSLTVFVVSVFLFRDTHENRPQWLDPALWSYIVYATIAMILMQELLYMNVKSSRYFLQLETWVKFGSLGFAVILPYTIVVVNLNDDEWPRHVATVALLLSWLEMMFLLSRFPNWGYYVLMFGKVASNVVKILLTFMFLVVGFSLSFMIQFRSQIPFDGPWAALVKTIVMMTSEFDYGALFDEAHSKELATSLIIVRIIFLIFLILAAIVLMNLLVGVAVNDINDLEVLGNIRRLVKQVEFLGTLDTLVYNRLFSAILPKRVNNSLKNKRNVLCVMILKPGKPRWKHSRSLPSRIKDAIFTKAQAQQKQIEDELGLQTFKTKLSEMHDAIMALNKKNEVKEKPDILKLPADTKARVKFDEVAHHLHDLDDAVVEMKTQNQEYVEESKCAMEELNSKIDRVSMELDTIKQFLTRLELTLSR